MQHEVVKSEAENFTNNTSQFMLGVHEGIMDYEAYAPVADTAANGLADRKGALIA